MKYNTQRLKKELTQLFKDLSLLIILPILITWGILILIWDIYKDKKPFKLFRLWDSWFWPKFFICLGSLSWSFLFYYLAFYNH